MQSDQFEIRSCLERLKITQLVRILVGVGGPNPEKLKIRDQRGVMNFFLFSGVRAPTPSIERVHFSCRSCGQIEAGIFFKAETSTHSHTGELTALRDFSFAVALWRETSSRHPTVLCATP